MVRFLFPFCLFVLSVGGSAVAFSDFFIESSAQSAQAFKSKDCLVIRLKKIIGGEEVHSLPIDWDVYRQILSSRKLKSEVPPQTVVVEEKVFRPSIFLGDKTHRVWLGTDSADKNVVIKILNNPAWHFMQEYEALVTEYYLSKGVNVPKIVAWDPKAAVLVKSYEEGLSFAEIREHSRVFFKLGYSTMGENTFKIALNQEIDRISKIHAGFEEWLHAHYPELSKDFLGIAKTMIKRGDLKESNFIFSVDQQKWILIDP